ncbi:MAG: MarR family transcriptional regulator [Micropruina sp.]|nr:MarR family transcriptional regulator [Micropruina sp.]
MSHDQLPNYAESPSFLLSQIGARSAQVFAERLRGEGMSPREFGVLTHVAANPGQTQQQLADALGIHRNNMVGLIDEVEAAGWVLPRAQPNRPPGLQRADHAHRLGPGRPRRGPDPVDG